MELLKYRTNETNGENVPGMKVYFACHPDDFEQTFNRICEDIFGVLQCFIYYTEDVSAEILRKDPEAVLSDMDLFVIPVTSRLLSEGNPAVDAVLSYAQKERMPVLPILMEEGVSEKYGRDDRFHDLPYIDSCEQDDTGLSYEKKLKKYLIIFLSMLTYVDGIRGKEGYGEPAERLVKAAEAEIEGSAEITELCFWMYRDGIGVPQDHQKAAVWCERLVHHSITEYGEEHSAVLKNMDELVRLYDKAGNYEKAIEQGEWLYNIQSRISDEEDPFTQRVLQQMCLLYGKSGNYEKAIELGEKLYEIRCRTLGEDEALTQASTRYLTTLYDISGSHKKAAEMGERIYESDCRNFGEEDPRTLITLRNLSVTYLDLGDYDKALELAEMAYKVQCRIFGEEHSQSLRTLVVAAEAYDRSGNHEKALELCDNIAAVDIELTESAQKRIEGIYERNGR